jgi:hypothetical protein
MECVMGELVLLSSPILGMEEQRNRETKGSSKKFHGPSLFTSDVG